ncbi:MAG: hypothetical protein LBN18_00120 [Dysgonamonadaceae bacterium]|jgi:hypothetical protein|nr:hypothetical protein [Dysgonamonadaceae bacterium]
MKEALKVTIIFLIVFNFKMPFLYNSVVLAGLLTGFYYLYTRKSIPFTYFFFRYNAGILIATIIFAVITTAITVFHEGFYFVTVMRLGVQFYMISALIFALPLIIEDRESEAFELACKYICYAFTVQGFIHLLGYLIPEVGDFLMSIKPEEIQAAIKDPHKNIDLFRAYALSGSIFFELPSAYGVAFIAFMRLQLMENQKYITGYMRYAVFTLIVVGIMLTGRVGFVGIGFGLLLYFLFVADPIVILARFTKRALLFIPAILAIYFFVLSPAQQHSFENQIFKFAFEAFYNYSATGHLSTSSTNTTFYAFYFPIKDDTILFGHGINGRSNEFYTFTDAGYMRSLIFGGVFFLICQIIYQWLYFMRPVAVARANKADKAGRIDRAFFIILFVYILVLHVKDNALGVQHLTEVLFLFLGCTYLVKHYNLLDESKA